MTASPRIPVSAAQFAASERWEENVEIILPLIDAAERDGVRLLVLPEGVLARFTTRRERIKDAAQPLDGPFVTALLQHTRGAAVTVVVGIHETSDNGRPYNTLVALRGGEIIAVYRKLHLYDAFSGAESDNITAADEVPPLIDVDGFRIGLMTCYDVRFPELARLLALRGADAIALPAAWARGLLKEAHWRTLVTARALDNTLYLVASGEAGAGCIGQSLIVDPLGVTIAQAAEAPAVITNHLDRERIEHARSSLPVLEHRRFEVDPTPRALPPVHTPILERS